MGREVVTTTGAPESTGTSKGATVAVGLVYAEMQAAAQAVGDAIEPLQSTLNELSATIETQAGTGFRGQAAAGFGEAVNAWFEEAVTLGRILDGYAQSLVELTRDHAATDGARAESADRIADRLGREPR